MRWLRVALTALALLFLLTPGRAARVSAHANLIRSEPAGNSVVASPPRVVRLWFDDALEVGLNSLAVLDSSGRAVPSEGPVLSADRLVLSLALPSGLPEGTYTVSYRTVSTSDGHNVRGFYIFSVGAAGSLPAGAAALAHIDWTLLAEPATALTAWLLLLAALTLAGSIVLTGGLLHAPAHKGLWTDPAFGRAVRRAIAGSALALLAVQVAALARYASEVTNGSLTDLVTTPALAATLAASRFSVLWLARMALTAALLAAVWRWDGGTSAGFGLRGVRRALLMTAAAAMLLTFSAQSHAAAVATSQASFWPVMMDWLHLLAAAVWAGGVFLLLALWGSGRVAWVRQVAPAFGVWALLAAGVLAVTGFYQTGVQSPQPVALHDTAYGWLLAVKEVLIAAVLVIGVAARQRLSQSAAASWRWRLPRPGAVLLGAEAALGAAVLLAAAWLSNTPPPRDAVAAAARMTVPLGAQGAGDLRAALALRPRPGGWEVEVALADALQQPVPNAARVTVGAGVLGRDTGWSTVVAAPQGAGRYTAAVQWLASDGPWGMFVTVRRRGVAEDVTALYGVRVDGPQVTPLNYSTSASAIYTGAERSAELWGLVETAGSRDGPERAANGSDVYITLTDPTGAYLDWVEGVRVSATPAIGPGGVTGTAGGYRAAEKLGPGRFLLRGVRMDVLGDWAVRAQLAGPGQEAAAEGFFTFLSTLDGVQSLGGGFPPGHH